MKYWMIIVCCCVSIGNLFSQVINATTSAKDAFVGQAFDLRYEIQGAENASFTPPDFSPLTLVAGPFTSNSITIINGQRSASKTYTYRLLAKKKGTISVAPAKMKIGNQTYTSNRVNIRVIEKSVDNVIDFDEIFLEVELNDSTVYTGQQLLMDHYIYYGKKRIASTSLASDFPRDRFLVNQIIDGTRIQTQQVDHNGKIVNKAHISRLGIFPLRSGDMEIPQTTFKVDIQSDKYTRRGFFTFLDRKQKLLSSPAQHVNVLPVPADKPVYYTEIVGQVEMTLDAAETSLNLGQEGLVRLKVQGNGIGEQLVIPSWQDDFFKIYDPKLVEERVIDLDGQINFIKEYDLLVVPQESGDLQLRLPFSYFDSRRDRFVQSHTNILRFSVSNNGKAKSDALDKSLNDATGSNNNNKLIYWLVGLLALIGGGAYLYFNRSKNNTPILTEEDIQEKAKEIAISKLSQAKSLLDNQQTDKYWETLEKSIQMYVQEKLNLPTTHFNKESVMQNWKEMNLPVEELETWKGFNDKINLARYAGQSISKMEGLYVEALDWIQKVESKSISLK